MGLERNGAIYPHAKTPLKRRIVYHCWSRHCSVAESRATMLNLMVDTLLDFRAIAFLTSILLLTTTLVSTCPIVFITPSSLYRFLTNPFSRKNGPTCNLKNAHVSVMLFNRNEYHCCLVDCRIYTYTSTYFKWQNGSEKLEKH